MTSLDPAMREKMKTLLTNAFKAGVTAAHPDALLARDAMRDFLRDLVPHMNGRVVMLGAGKASAAMGAAFAREWADAGGTIHGGLIVTREGFACDVPGVEIALAGHPYADDRSLDAADRLLGITSELTQNDLCVGLWSGGGSSLLTAPLPGLAPEDLQALGRALVNAGADIHEINTVRRHLSRASGGRLAQAVAPAKMLNIILPDVVAMGDDDALAAAVASGPGVPDPTTLDEARAVLERWNIDAAPAIKAALSDPANETPKTWEDIGTGGDTTIILPGDAALMGAASFLQEQLGVETQMIEPDATGDALAVGRAFAEGFGQARGGPAAFVNGGEVTVTVTGDGTGGPNQEFALAMALHLNGAPDVYALSGDTDGIDGIGGAAGAFIAPDSLERLSEADVDAVAALRNNDAGGAFAAIDDLIVTGPTFTNVNDLRLIVIHG